MHPVPVQPDPGAREVTGAPTGLPRSARIREAQAYQQVFRDPLKLSGKHFVIYARSNAYGHARLGLAIAKKAVKKAADRNRLKRVSRESFRRRRTELPPYDLIVTARRDIEMVPNRELFSSLDELWSKLISRCARS